MNIQNLGSSCLAGMQVAVSVDPDCDITTIPQLATRWLRCCSGVFQVWLAAVVWCRGAGGCIAMAYHFV